MNDWATTRLVLTGPSSELLGLHFHCIRPQRFDDSGEEEFDFESLIPMPPEIVATLDDRSEAARQLAMKATGHPSSYEWCHENWGTKSNASATDVHASRRDRFDLTFETPGGCPQPILHALAAHYPNLKGCVFTVNHNADRGFAGKIVNGIFTGSELALPRDVHFVTHRCTEESDISDLSATALTGDWTDWEDPILSPEDAVKFGVAAAARIKSAAPPGWARAIDFEADYRAYSEADGDWEAAESVMLHPANLAFFRADDRCRTELDQALIQSIAANLCADAFDQNNPVTSRLNWRKDVSMQLTHVGDDQLYAWAALALYRPNVTLDMTDAKALKLSFVDYATQLREQALVHLISQEDGDLHRPLNSLPPG